MSITKVFVEEYKGKPIIGIWNVDKNDRKTDKYPIVSFGEKKAKAILEHHDEIEHWVVENNSVIIDLSNNKNKF